MAHRARLLALTVVAAAGLGAALNGGASGAASQLLFVTYNGTTPVVTLPSGAAVGTSNPPGTLIPAGVYTVEISVSSLPADFQIVGPGLNFLDNEPSTEVYTITFAASSTYSYEDVDNPGTTVGYFSTTATFGQGSSTPPSVTSKNPQANSDVVGSAVAAAKKPETLEATVSARGTVSLDASAKRVAKLGAKRYVVVVEDRSRKAGFTLQKRGGRALELTGTSFTGKQSLTLALGAGTWFYYSSPAHKDAFVVS
jgi:hypothetical protein